MGRPSKWLIAGLGVLAVIALVVALAGVLLLDPQRVRDRLVSVVRDQTGRELQIAQPVDLSLFPWFGVALREVSLGNAPGFGDEPLARADELRVRVKVLPLLSGNVEVDSLVLRGLALNLARNAQGDVNWRDVRVPTPAAAGGAGGAGRAGAPSAPGVVAFLVGGIELSDGRLSWRDQRAGTGYVLDALELRTGAIAAGLAAPVRVGTRLRLEPSGRELGLAGTGNLELGERLATIAVPDLDLSVRAEGEGLPKSGLDLRVRSALRYDRESDALVLAPLQIAGGGVQVTGEVRGARLAGDPAFEGRLELAPTSPRDLLALFGKGEIATADPAVLARLTATLPFKTDARSVAIDGLSLTLDDTALTGRLSVVDLATGAIRFDLAADRLDVDRYLSPATAASGEAPGQAKVAAPQAAGAVVAGGAGLPVETLRALDLDGSLRVGTLRIGGARLSDVRTQWRARGGAITQTAEARLYGGSGRSTSTVDVRPAQPGLAVKASLQGVDLRGLLADTTGQSRVAGTATADADLRWNGLSEAEFRRTLGGTARLALRDGAIQGFDLDALVQNGLAAAQGGRAGGGANQTAFSELTATLTAQNGVLSNRDLRATSSLLSLTGGGTIDLPANRIDYLARATLQESARGRLGGRLAELGDTPIPVRFTGSLDAPKVTLDVEEVLRTRAGQQIQRKVEEKLKGEWGDKLRKFLDR